MQPTTILLLIATVASITVSLFGAALLIARPLARRDQSFWLAGFLSVYSVTKLDALFTLTGGYLAAPHTAGILFLFKPMLGPIVYFYTSAMIATTPRGVEWRDLWVLGGPILIFFLFLPFYVLGAEDKMAIITHDFADEGLREWVFTMCRTTFLIFFLISIASLVAALRLLRRHLGRLRNLFSNIEDRSLDWLRRVLLILTAGWTFSTASDFWAIAGSRPDAVNVLATYLELGWIACIAFFGIMQAPVLSKEDVKEEPSQAPYARARLSDEQLSRIAQKLHTAMAQNQLFTDADLSLRALAAAIGVSEAYLSQTFSLKMGTTFFDYVNAQRIELAKSQLASTDQTVLTIAHAAGFNSRSTFNTAFKKHTASTPTEFRRRAQQCKDGDPVESGELANGCSS